MAWTEFYMQTTGSDLNAGSTSDDAASVTTTNGGWDTATRVFTAASGTPFSGVAAGEWVSIYLDAATATPFIAQVESVGGGGASITVSATARIGTQPTTGASGRSCRIGGAWASFGASVLSASTTLVTPCRVNVKAATYANTTTTRSVSWTGTTEFPFCMRGYNTTPGDLDNVSDGTRPEVTFTTGSITFSSSFQNIQNLNFSCSSGTQPLFFAATDSSVVRCRCVNTNASASSVAISTSARQTYRDCYFACTSSSTTIVSLPSGPVDFTSCVFSGGGHGVTVAGNIRIAISDCAFLSMGGDALRITSASADLIVVKSNLFYNSAGDGIKITVNSTSGRIIATDNVFSNCGGYAINNSSGTNTNRIFVANNLYYNNTSGNLNGLGDTADIGSVTDVSSPFVDAAGGDFTLASTSNGYGFSRKFENVATTSYADIGAVQHQPSRPSPRTRVIKSKKG